MGRVVIPKEIRRTMRIHEGDPLEIYTGYDGEVIFKRYSPLTEIESISQQLAEALNQTTNRPVVVCDRFRVMAVVGIPKMEVYERRVSTYLDDFMQKRKPFGMESDRIQPVEGIERYAVAGAPILAGEEVFGAILLLEDENSMDSGEAEHMLIETAAAFLGKQMDV
jgi:AbrB family transcriptional regulator (stage V sporulation protein T)